MSLGQVTSRESALPNHEGAAGVIGLASRFLILATLWAALGACATSPEQIDASESIQEAQTPLPSASATPSPSPHPTQTPTPIPTKTRVPTPTSEPLPTTCLDPEAIEQVRQDFLQFRGFSSVDDVLSGVTRWEGYAGLENGPSWYIFSNLKALGGYRISLEGLQGFGEGDFANCLIAAQPRLGEEYLIPIIVGLQRGGEWSQSAVLSQRSFDLSPAAPGERLDLNSPEEADRWIESLRGEDGGREIEIYPLVVVRYDKPDWERDPLWYFGYDQVLPLLQAEEGYIMRYTRNPSLLGESMYLPDGRPWGEATTFAEVVPALKNWDIAMFAWQITVFRDSAD